MIFVRIHQWTSFTKNLFIGGITCLSIFQTLSCNTNIENQVKKIIEEHLENQNRTIYQIPSSFSYDYNHTLEISSEYINEFLKTMDSIVLNSELTHEINKAIDKRLKKYNISRKNISATFKNTLSENEAEIKQKLQKYMYYNNNDEYITKQKIQDVITAKIDYNFIQEIKNNTPSSWSWGEAIGGLISGVVNAISSSNSPSNSSSSNNSSASLPIVTYYSHKCPICQEDFYGNERVGVTSCGHCYHPQCIKQALEYEKKCPVCREKEIYLAKIYNSKEEVPGYYPNPNSTADIVEPITPDPLINVTPPYNPEIFEEEPSAPEWEEELP